MNSCKPLSNDAMLNVSKRAVADWMNDKQNVQKLYEHETPFEVSDFYVVWFCKTLQNWKALVSTDRRHGLYFEVTANGDKREIYLDAYQKEDNKKLDFSSFGLR